MWIQDQGNRRRVIRRKPNKKALANTTVPFRDLFPILKPRIKDINQSAKNMGTGKVGVRAFDTRPQFFRREPISRGRQSIIDPHRVIQSQGPQV